MTPDLACPTADTPLSHPTDPLAEQLASWDGEMVILKHDRETGVTIVIAVHSTRLGPADGGTRMRTYPNTTVAIADALGLARAMTYKHALSGMACGGGKAVIAIPAPLTGETRTALLRRYGEVLHRLGGMFQTGPDVGMSSADMDVIAETGTPYVGGRSPAAGGAGDTGEITAVGVAAGIEVVCERLFGDVGVRGRRVLVQGVGSVGAALARRLKTAGATVLLSDVSEPALTAVQRSVDADDVPPSDVYATECDVFAPCAVGGVLTAETIPQLRCRAIVGGANCQLGTAEDAERLYRRGILYAPDFAVNVGGALGGTGMDYLGWSAAEAHARVVAHVRDILQRIFDGAERGRTSPETVARRMVEDRLRSGGRHPASP